MSKKMIRLITALLILLFAMSCFAGCADTQNNGDDTSDNPSKVTPGDSDNASDGGEGSSEAPVETTLEDLLGFEIPKMNTNFNILYSQYDELKNDITGDSTSGDEVSAKVHERNLNVEETFGVTLNFINNINTWNTRAEDLQYIQNVVASGGNDFDMVLGINVAMATMMYTGCFHNLSDVNTINMDHDWWMANTEESYGIGGKVYGLMGDIAHSLYSNTSLIALNTTLADKFGVSSTYGDLYDMVYDGKWTLDKMIEIGAAYGEDNGDGVMTIGEDTFGLLVLQVPSRLFAYAFDIDIIQRNADNTGVVLPEQLDEKVVNSYEKLYDVLPKTIIGSKPYIAPSNKTADVQAAFGNGKSLMIAAYFSYLGKDVIKNQMTDDYMLLPMPKYDEAQDDYRSPIATTAGMVLIPLTAVDAEKSGMIMEYMAYYGQQNIVPVYINNTLKLKYAADEKVSGMVDYILERSQFNLTQVLCFNCESGDMKMSNMYAFGNLNKVESPAINSFYQTYRDGWQGDLDAICAGLK